MAMGPMPRPIAAESTTCGSMTRCVRCRYQRQAAHAFCASAKARSISRRRRTAGTVSSISTSAHGTGASAAMALRSRAPCPKGSSPLAWSRSGVDWPASMPHRRPRRQSRRGRTRWTSIGLSADRYGQIFVAWSSMIRSISSSAYLPKRFCAIFEACDLAAKSPITTMFSSFKRVAGPV